MLLCCARGGWGRAYERSALEENLAGWLFAFGLGLVAILKKKNGGFFVGFSLKFSRFLKAIIETNVF